MGQAPAGVGSTYRGRLILSRDPLGSAYYHPMNRKHLAAAVAVLASLGILTACGSDSATHTVTVTESAPPSFTVPASPSGWSQSAQDETFLSQVSLIEGFETVSRADKLVLAHQVCTSFENHIQDQVLKILTESYGINSATKFMHTAASVYCPEQLSS